MTTRAVYLRRYRAKNRARGACQDCGKFTPLARERGYCLGHLRKHRERTKRAMAARRALRVCVQCKAPTDGTTRCAIHRAAQAAYMKAQHAAHPRLIEGRRGCSLCRGVGHDRRSCPQRSGVRLVRPVRAALVQIPVRSSWELR